MTEEEQRQRHQAEMAQIYANIDEMRANIEKMRASVDAQVIENQKWREEQKLVRAQTERTNKQVKYFEIGLGAALFAAAVAFSRLITG